MGRREHAAVLQHGKGRIRACSGSRKVMWHLSTKLSRDSFGSLVEVLADAQCSHCLPPLSRAGIKSARALEDSDRSIVRSLLGDVDTDKLFAPRIQVRPAPRKDVPVVHPYARGSLQRVGISQGSSQGHLDMAKADEEFALDKFAKTSRAPRESRWVTWQKMASSRGLAPVPLSVELIDKVGSILKAARYRSPAQYYAIAKEKHMQQGFAWSPELELARNQAIRSVLRGVGPSEPKLDLEVDKAGDDFANKMASAYFQLQQPEHVRLPYPAETVVAASWFLLRGIEIANVTCADVTFRKERRAVVVRLPVSKTDVEAKGCERTHVCICNPVHVPGCPAETHASLMFTRLQKCSCSQGRSPLCVFHALMHIVLDLRLRQQFLPEKFLFGHEGAPAVRQVSALAQSAAFVLQEQSLFEWGPKAVEKWAQHSFRVAGAQMFARANIPLPTIQVIGRWGSTAIMRYVQNSVFVPEQAALTVQAAWSSSPAPSSSSTPSSQTPSSTSSSEVWAIVRRVVSEVWQHQAAFIHNPRSKFAHRPSPSEHSLASEHWISACGKWRYGRSNCLRHPSVLPGFQKCAKCFSEDPAAAAAPQGEEEQSSSSSSSS